MKARIVFRPLVLFAAAFALFTVLLVSSGALAQPAQTIKLKVADVFPPAHWAVVHAAKPWMDRVVQLSKTKVEFQYFPAEQLGKQADMMNLLRTGVAEIVYTPPASLSGDFPLHSFWGLPGLYSTMVEGTRYYEAMLKEGPLRDEFTKKGARPLFLWQNPLGEIVTVKKAVFKPEDVKNLKIRTVGGAQDSVIKALGGVPVQVQSPDVYTALQRGTVDGALMAFSTVQSYKINEVIKYTTFGSGLCTGILGYSILEDRWQKLPADVREAMSMASQEIVISASKWEDDQVAELASNFQKAGVQINRLSKDDQALWKKALDPVMVEWIKQMEAKGLPGQKVFDSYKNAISGR